jgi:hypothetical protein
LAFIHLDIDPLIQEDLDDAIGNLGGRDKTDESDAGRFTLEKAAPKVEPLAIDCFLFAEFGRAHAALRVLINE